MFYTWFAAIKRIKICPIFWFGTDMILMLRIKILSHITAQQICRVVQNQIDLNVKLKSMSCSCSLKISLQRVVWNSYIQYMVPSKGWTFPNGIWNYDKALYHYRQSHSSGNKPVEQEEHGYYLELVWNGLWYIWWWVAVSSGPSWQLWK